MGTTGRVFQTSNGDAIEILTMPVSIASGVISLNGPIDAKSLQLQMLPLPAGTNLASLVNNANSDGEHIML